MKDKIVLLTERLRIKTLRLDDITPEYLKGLNDPEVNKFLVNVRLKRQTKKTVSDFISQNLESPSDMFLGIFLKKDCTFIGTIKIGGISNFHYLCSVGICFFAKEYCGKGYASEALRRTIDFIFKKLKLHHIEAGVYKNNRLSMKLFKRAGFKARAFYKDKYRYQGDFEPVIIWGLTNHEFDKALLK